MDMRHLTVEVRLEEGIAVLDLVGEINGFAEEALNAAYAEAEAKDPETILLNFEGVDYINSTGIPHSGAARQGARLPPHPARLQPKRALRGNLQHHAPLGLHERFPRRADRRGGSVGVLRNG